MRINPTMRTVDTYIYIFMLFYSYNYVFMSCNYVFFHDYRRSYENQLLRLVPSSHN